MKDILNLSMADNIKESFLGKLVDRLKQQPAMTTGAETTQSPDSYQSGATIENGRSVQGLDKGQFARDLTNELRKQPTPAAPADPKVNK